MEIQIRGEVERQQLHDLADYIPVGSKVVIDKSGKISKRQRGALHVWCKELAEVLNDCGRYRIIISPIDRRGREVPWAMITVKEDIYKIVLSALTKKSSTEDQSTVEPSAVAMVISKHFAETGLICPPWPSLR